MDKIKTGDILLFDEKPAGCLWKFLDGCIKCCTRSKYSHSAFALRDPSWLGLSNGLYVWESTGFTGLKDVVDNKEKFGVQVQHIDEYTKEFKGGCTIYAREAPQEARDLLTDNFLNNIYNNTHDKPYDDMPLDWLEAMLKVGPNRRTDMFWCSAFVSYILTKANIINKNTDCSMMTPQDLSFNSDTISWNIPYSNDKKVVFSKNTLGKYVTSKTASFSSFCNGHHLVDVLPGTFR